MKFKFRKVPDTTNPKGYQRLPLLEVRLWNGSRHHDVLCLIDSGADDCMFHSSIADILGIDLEKGRFKPFAGIGAQWIGAYLHPVRLQVQGFAQQVDIEVAFTEDNQISLLGQNGFFDNYTVIFERHRNRFEVKGRNPLLRF